MALSDDTIKTLTDAGWTPQYRFDPEAYRPDLEKDGHELSEKAKLFLTLWGGLRVRIPVEKPYTAFFHTNAIWATAGMYPKHFREVEKTVGEKVCPVGETDCGHTLVSVGVSGAVYLSWDGDESSKIADWPDDQFDSVIAYLAKSKVYVKPSEVK